MTKTVDNKLEILGAVSLVNAKYNPFTIGGKNNKNKKIPVFLLVNI